MKYDAFISYVRKDVEFVYKLAQSLSENGYKVFYDSTDIISGGVLLNSLKKAIENSTSVIIIMSPDYFKSRWAETELEISMDREFKTNQVYVLPVLYRDCEIPSILDGKVYLDFRDAQLHTDGFRKLAEAISHTHNRKSIFNLLLRKKNLPNDNLGIGEIPKEKYDSIELKSIVEELNSKIERLLENADSNNQSVKFNSSKIDSKRCFTVMPFNSVELNDVYEYFIKPAIENKCDLNCIRGDDVFGSNIIMDDIRESIENSRLIIADLTGRNPNVFYEVGIAHTLKKDVLLISQTLDDVPFDLRHMRVLIYDYTPGGCKKLEFAIVENVKHILSGRPQSDK
jgi:hypothetical protein